MGTESSVNKRSGNSSFRIFSGSCVWLSVLIVLTLGNVEKSFSKTNHPEIKWNKLMKGLAISDISISDVECKGESSIKIIRMAFDSWEFQPHYYKKNVLQKKMSAHNWLNNTDSRIVINAGQFDENYKHLGWFIRNGKNMGSNLHPIWKGIFACKPKSPEIKPEMTIIDEESSPQKLSNFEYLNAVQSLMLFDSSGKIRVNKSNQFDRRCIIGIDDDKYVYIFLSIGEVTLWDMAIFLQSLPLDLDRAMSMDGGIQAQLSVKTDKYECNLPTFQTALPCAICFKPTAN